MSNVNFDTLRRHAHQAIRKVLSAPDQLVQILTCASRLRQATASVADHYGLDLVQAETVAVQRFQLLISTELDSSEQ